MKEFQILGNTTSDTGGHHLCSNNIKIRNMFLQKNVIPTVQPMDQGIIVVCKILYQPRYLNKVLVLEEDDSGKIHNNKATSFQFCSFMEAVKLKTNIQDIV